MKTYVLALILASGLPAWGQKPAAEYNLDVQVLSSWHITVCPPVNCFAEQHMKVAIGNEKYELADVGMASKYLLKPGSYKARILKEDAPNGYESRRQYQLLFPDGKMRTFEVVAEEEM